MPTPNEELLQLVEHVLDLMKDDESYLEHWKQTPDGKKVIQYVVQIGKYNTNIGEGRDIAVGDQELLKEIRDSLKPKISPQKQRRRKLGIGWKISVIVVAMFSSLLLEIRAFTIDIEQSLVSVVRGLSSPSLDKPDPNILLVHIDKESLEQDKIS